MIRALILVAMLVPGPARADPLFGIAGTLPASGDYGEVLEGLRATSADATSLTLFWDDFMVEGRYAPETDWPPIANAVYPATGLALTLTIPVIDTVADRRPADLQVLAWDDPALATAFVGFVEEVLARMPDLPLIYLAIGNEVDGFLQGPDWQAYGRFFTAVRRELASTHPDLPIGVTLTWGGLRNRPEARALADLGDAWLVTWYPLGPGFEVLDPALTPRTLTEILTAAGDHPVYLAEAGYPSGGCGGSEARQARFVEYLIEENDPRLRLVMLVWMHDLSVPEIAGYTEYYGVDSPCFAGYLATLGLRSHAGPDKPAFTLLRNR